MCCQISSSVQSLKKLSPCKFNKSNRPFKTKVDDYRILSLIKKGIKNTLEKVGVSMAIIRRHLYEYT